MEVQPKWHKYIVVSIETMFQFKERKQRVNKLTSLFRIKFLASNCYMIPGVDTQKVNFYFIY
jgi:hypothetical protein